MPFIPPTPVIRRNMIVKKLRDHGAVIPEKALTLAEAGVPNPNGMRIVTDVLVKQGKIVRTEDGRYYLK